MDPSPPRRVRTLRLRAPREPLIRRGAILLADALHTATLPGDDARLWVVRHLDVGAIHPGESSAALALRVEARLRQVTVQAVHGSRPDGERRPAVYFRDELEPYILLARHLAQGGTASAWYWPRAIRPWDPRMATAAGLGLLLAGAAGTRVGPVGALHLVRALLEANCLDPLLACLTPLDGDAWLRRFGWDCAPRRLPPGRGPGQAPSWPAPPASLPGQDALIRWARQWGLEDARTRWLAAGLWTLASTWAGTWLLDPGGLMAQVDQWLQARAGETGQAAAQAGTPDQALPPAAGRPESLRRAQDGLEPVDSEAAEAGQASDRLHREGRQPSLPPASAPAHAPRGQPSARQGQEAEAPRARPPAGSELDPPPVPGEEDGRQASRYAGRLFLLNVLNRLAFGPWLAEHPAWLAGHFPAHLWHHLDRRLDLDGQDPLLLALAPPLPAPAQLADLGDLHFVAPAAWRATVCRGEGLQLRRLGPTGEVRLLRDGSGRLSLATWHGDPPPEVPARFGPVPENPDRVSRGLGASASRLDLACQAWTLAIRRWLWRYARLGLAETVKRPGYIAATPTHVDIYFPIRDTDLAIRKAGLDLDPGWVPWFQRVVTFHYVDDPVDDDALPGGFLRLAGDGNPSGPTEGTTGGRGRP
ncbi:MAG: hypothetical protein KatS3mg050_1019 [Litorilinea sp.]|nr:MAG: hypothetical protein KatS3mg050_1019 [Litorilinea sp.]